MAWNLGDAVVRGELFHLKRNSVHGWVELLGSETGLHLNLTGNMQGELEGKRVHFETALAESEPASPTEAIPDTPVSSQAPKNLDFEALEIQQIGPTGTMTLTRAQGNGGKESTDFKLILEWFSQNGQMRIELDNPRIAFLPADSDDQPPLDPDIAARFAGLSPYRHFDEADEVELPADADADDPYGLFPPELESKIEEETRSQEIAAIDEGTENSDFFLAENPGDLPKTRAWDEVIPGIDEQTRRLYESWDEIFEGKKDVPLSTIFDPPLALYPADKLSDSEVEAALGVILRRLAMHSVALDMCEHFSPRDAYRMLVEEILPERPIYPGLPLTGYVQHYSTWEHCVICDAELEARWQAQEKERQEREARGESDDDPSLDDDVPF